MNFHDNILAVIFDGQRTHILSVLSSADLNSKQIEYLDTYDASRLHQFRNLSKSFENFRNYNYTFFAFSERSFEIQFYEIEVSIGDIVT